MHMSRLCVYSGSRGASGTSVMTVQDSALLLGKDSQRVLRGVIHGKDCVGHPASIYFCLFANLVFHPSRELSELPTIVFI